MALQQEVWVGDIQKTLEQEASFLPYSVDDSAYIAFKTVHLPQEGGAASVIVNPVTVPLPIAERTDAEKLYSMNQYALTPILIPNIDELQVSYDKRSSVTGQQFRTLVQEIGNRVANSWTADGAIESDSIVLTSGTASGNALSVGATGTRNKVILIDIANCAKKMDKDEIPRIGRKMLMQSDMFWELMEISDVLRASYNGFQGKPNVLATGVVAQLFGFDIMIRSTVSVFTQTGVTAKAVGAASTAADRSACIAWHPSVVSRAVGAMTPYYDAGSNGNGKPEYLGAIFNMDVMLGSAIRRNDLKGVVALVQGFVST